MTAAILPLPEWPCSQCGVRSAPLGEFCPATPADDPDCHDFTAPPTEGRKLPSLLRVGRDLVRVQHDGHARYELVKRVHVREDGWVIVGTTHSEHATTDLFPVLWMDSNHARDVASEAHG